MTAEYLEFRLQELAKENAEMLLSKVSGVSLEVIQNLGKPLVSPLTSESFTLATLTNLVKLAAALNVPIYNLLASEEAEEILLDRLEEIMNEQRVEISIGSNFSQPEPRERRRLQINCIACCVTAPEKCPQDCGCRT